MTADSINPAADGDATAKRALALSMSGYGLSLVGALTFFNVPIWLTMGLLVVGWALILLARPWPVGAGLTWWEHLIQLGVSVVILAAMWLAGDKVSNYWPVPGPGLMLGWICLYNGYRDFRDRRNALHPPAEVSSHSA